jgi:NitT/TauT family transport system substrate-binding protein
MKKGEIDVISHLDPVIAKLEADGDIRPLVDTRTEAGTRVLFGGSNPAAVGLRQDGLREGQPNTCQRLVNAFVKSLQWLQSATPDQVAETVPPEYHLGDKGLYLAAVKSSMESYSRDGIVPREGMTSVHDMLRTLDPELQGAKVDLAATFTDRFVKAAAG